MQVNNKQDVNVNTLHEGTIVEVTSEGKTYMVFINEQGKKVLEPVGVLHS